jgi:NADH-quinone oxidoreductase subunit G
MSDNTKANAAEMVKITIDGQSLQVPKGMNVIEAAKELGIDIPHYCYHPNLSIVGNCRMCKVEVVGAPKLEIGCNLSAREGLEVKTHLTSPRVKETQAANLEFILVNHPLDCTVCDQSGHCKLQDYHYEYNARPSRFVEEKEHKVKAEPLGPTVMLDGERCIMCTRCIRFCDEITGTSELGMLNRGDRSVIAVSADKPLNNPLSGSVVDLCPVGALTHTKWRFNTRIWFTSATDAICPGCSTGCNVKVHERDGEIVQVKARVNQQVNQEWMCDEGRYGFARFLPAKRLNAPVILDKQVSLDEALKAAEGFSGNQTQVFISPDLTLEDYLVTKLFLDKVVKKYKVVIAYRERKLDPVQKILISPDYACNFQGAILSGLVSGDLESEYEKALKDLQSGVFERVIFIGQRSILEEDCDAPVLAGIAAVKNSLGILAEADSGLVSSLKVVLPGRSILEKSGMLVNRKGLLQYAQASVPFPEGSHPEWRQLLLLAVRHRINLLPGLTQIEHVGDRELTNEILKTDKRFSGLSIKLIKNGGVHLSQLAGLSQAPQSAAAPTPLEAR